jgi:hypothetical protein
MAVRTDGIEPDLRSVLQSMGCTHVPRCQDVDPAGETRDATAPNRSTGLRWLVALARGFAAWSPYGFGAMVAATLRSRNAGRQPDSGGDHTP